MSREQLLAVIVVLGVLSGAIQQFYSLKAEVEGLRIRFEYTHGAGWTPEPKSKE